MDFSLKSYLSAHRKTVDSAIGKFLPAARVRPSTVHEAMRYSMFAGGKRLRPILTLAAAEACGGEIEPALPSAAAVECIHTYSLIHDDLPCMDDDDFRRGMPSSHIKFGEGVAVLAGDALLTIAFEILAKTVPIAKSRYTVADFFADLADTAGSRKLIGGQILDLEGEGENVKLTPAQLRLGGMAANATPKKLESLSEFGHSVGLAFQVIDDILDVTQTSEKLGKSAGKDEASDKSTYPAMFGLEKSRKEAARLSTKALKALKPFGRKGERLEQIAHYLLDRDY